MPKKPTGRALAKFKAERNIWQEILGGVRKIKASGVKRVVLNDAEAAGAKRLA